MICKTLWGMNRNDLYLDVEQKYMNIVKNQREIEDLK